MTVASAISGAYGTLKSAYLSHVAVVRGALTHPQMTVVDYRRVIRGGARDVALQPGDIVFVPLSPYRYIEHYLEVILNTFVAQTAINAGTSVVGLPTTASQPGVFIPLGSGIQVIPPAAPPAIH